MSDNLDSPFPASFTVYQNGKERGEEPTSTEAPPQSAISTTTPSFISNAFMHCSAIFLYINSDPTNQWTSPTPPFPSFAEFVPGLVGDDEKQLEKTKSTTKNGVEQRDAQEESDHDDDEWKVPPNEPAEQIQRK